MTQGVGHALGGGPIVGPRVPVEATRVSNSLALVNPRGPQHIETSRKKLETNQETNRIDKSKKLILDEGFRGSSAGRTLV